MIDHLYKACFAFFCEAGMLIPSEELDHLNRKMLFEDKETVIRTIREILLSADLEHPRFDIFVNAMGRLGRLYSKLGQENFHPAFRRVLFGPRTRRTWEHLHDSREPNALPSEVDARVMRVVSWDLNELMNSDKVFKTPIEEEYIGNEGAEEDNP